MNDVHYGHYTTTPAMMNIIKAESLWATNIKFLNDEEEFFHALDLIGKITRITKMKETDPRHEAFQKYTKAIAERLESLDRYRSESIFTLSFSEEVDLLSQWRGYCPENNGYCIVYDLGSLFDELKKRVGRCYLDKCIYDNAEKEAKLKAILNKYFPQYLPVSAEKKARNLVIDSLAEELQRLACYFKHPTFAEEKEHRIVIDRQPTDGEFQVRFRTGRFSLVPYMEVPAARNFIKKIYIGPTTQPKLANRALDTFLEITYGVPTFIGDVEIANSGIPYRAW